MILEPFYYRTFAKVAVIPYVGGTVAHTLRLIYKFPIIEMPSWIHWVIVLVGGYVVTGFVLFAHKIEFRSIIDKVLYGLVICHLGASVVLHLYSIIMRSNDWLGVFPMEFSYFALLYFIGFGLFLLLYDRTFIKIQQNGA